MLGEVRIMGGQEARRGQFPWVAYLSIKGPGIDKMCAGTLVTPRYHGDTVMVVMMDTCCRYVLTAGHCVDFCSMKIDPDCRRSDPFPQINIKVDTTILYVHSL